MFVSVICLQREKGACISNFSHVLYCPIIRFNIWCVFVYDIVSKYWQPLDLSDFVAGSGMGVYLSM